MNCISWTPSGNVDPAGTIERVLGSKDRSLALQYVLFEVWVDAYAHGYSAGLSSANPEIYQNPYCATPQEDTP